jgi:hypothetical protein
MVLYEIPYIGKYLSGEILLTRECRSLFVFFVLFHLDIALSVHIQFTVSDYTCGIFKPFFISDYSPSRVVDATWLDCLAV